MAGEAGGGQWQQAAAWQTLPGTPAAFSSGLTPARGLHKRWGGKRPRFRGPNTDYAFPFNFLVCLFLNQVSSKFPVVPVSVASAKAHEEGNRISKENAFFFSIRSTLMHPVRQDFCTTHERTGNSAITLPWRKALRGELTHRGTGRGGTFPRGREELAGGEGTPTATEGRPGRAGPAKQAGFFSFGEGFAVVE